MATLEVQPIENIERFRSWKRSTEPGWYWPRTLEAARSFPSEGTMLQAPIFSPREAFSSLLDYTTQKIRDITPFVSNIWAYLQEKRKEGLSYARIAQAIESMNIISEKTSEQVKVHASTIGRWCRRMLTYGAQISDFFPQTEREIISHPVTKTIGVGVGAVSVSAALLLGGIFLTGGNTAQVLENPAPVQAMVTEPKTDVKQESAQQIVAPSTVMRIETLDEFGNPHSLKGILEAHIMRTNLGLNPESREDRDFYHRFTDNNPHIATAIEKTQQQMVGETPEAFIINPGGIQVKLGRNISIRPDHIRTIRLEETVRFDHLGPYGEDNSKTGLFAAKIADYYYGMDNFNPQQADQAQRFQSFRKLDPMYGQIHAEMETDFRAANSTLLADDDRLEVGKDYKLPLRVIISGYQGSIKALENGFAL